MSVGVSLTSSETTTPTTSASPAAVLGRFIASTATAPTAVNYKASADQGGAVVAPAMGGGARPDRRGPPRSAARRTAPGRTAPGVGFVPRQRGPPPSGGGPIAARDSTAGPTGRAKRHPASGAWRAGRGTRGETARRRFPP